MGEIAKLDNVRAIVYNMVLKRIDAMMLMSPESNFDHCLTAAPFAIALLGEIISILADTDITLEEKPPRYGFKHLCRPNSFRASLVQVINAERSSFNEAHTIMDQLFLQSGNVDGHVENTIRILLRGTPNEVIKMLPMSLTKIQNIPDVSLNLANAVEERFISVVELTAELLEACTITFAVVNEKSREIERAIKVAKVQREHREKVVKVSERRLLNMKTEDREMAHLKIKHIAVNKIRATLVKCIKALVGFREQWVTLLRYFQAISNIIQCCLRTALQDFVCAAKSGQEIKMGDLSTNVSNNLRDFIFERASEASKIAYVVCAISKTYVQISNKHLMDMITCLGHIIARDSQKEGQEILIKKRVLHRGCYKAQKAIQSIVLKQKLEFNQNIEERVRKIEEIQAKLTHFEPKREEKIKKSNGMKTFTDAELADLI